jgi:hypothetical protein
MAAASSSSKPSPSNKPLDSFRLTAASSSNRCRLRLCRRHARIAAKVIRRKTITPAIVPAMIAVCVIAVLLGADETREVGKPEAYIVVPPLMEVLMVADDAVGIWVVETVSVRNGVVHLTVLEASEVEEGVNNDEDRSTKEFEGAEDDSVEKGPELVWEGNSLELE